MNRLLILTLLALPAAAAAQGLSTASLDEAAPAAAAEEPAAEAPLKRPDAPAMMAELSSALRLSSKQEERISAAIGRKTKEFDKLMKDYEKNSAEEKKWRARTNESRYGLQKINRGMPDLVREFLDDEQRQAFDRLLEARRKPAPAAAEVAPAPSGQGPAKPARKRKLVRRRKLKGAPGARPAAPPAGAAEEGGVVVDKDIVPVAQPPEPRKKAAKKRPSAAAQEEEPAPEPPADESALPAQEPEPEEEDAGSYP